MANLVPHLEVLLLHALCFLQFSLCLCSSLLREGLEGQYRLYSEEVVARLHSESVLAACEKVVQVLPTLLQRAHNCLSVFHHAGIMHWVDKWTGSILKLLVLQFPREEEAISFSLHSGVRRFIKVTSVPSAATAFRDSLSLKRFKKTVETVFKVPPAAGVEQREEGEQGVGNKKRRRDQEDKEGSSTVS
jgi:hypothetical protein